MGDQSWAKNLDSLEGVECFPGNGSNELKSIWPGLGLATGLAVIANYLSKAPIWPFTNVAGTHPFDAILIAVLMGVILGNTFSLSEFWEAGVNFATKTLLPISIILLGARLDLFDLVIIGTKGLLLGFLVVGLTMVLFWVMARWWKFSAAEAILLGVGTAICGGSAIIAVAPVIRAKKAVVAVSVTTVTLIGLVAMFSLPAIAAIMGIEAEEFGLWTGMVIHQTPQVLAAGFMHSDEAGEIATVAKLVRVCLLAPVVIGVGLIWVKLQGNEMAANSKRWWCYVPPFVVGFLGMVLLRTMGLLPDLDVVWDTSRIFPPIALKVSLQNLFSISATFLLVVATVGIGLGTRLSAFRNSNLRAAGAAAIVSVVLSIVVFLAI